MVQLWNGAVVNQNVDTWDAHSQYRLQPWPACGEVDKPIAGLIIDLKRRGLLDETLVTWQSEFGRMPIIAEGRRPRPQSGSHDRLDGGRQDQGRPDHRRFG